MNKFELKKLIACRMYPIYSPYKYAKNAIKNYQVLNKLKKEGTNLNFNLGVSEVSDTIFILGSGNSINDISREKWNHIESKDTLGFNFWLIHDFVPTYYSFEVPRDSDRKDEFLRLLNQKAEIFKFNKTKVIIKDYNSEWGRQEIESIYNLVPWIHFLNDIDITPPCERLLSRSIHCANRFKKILRFFSLYKEMLIIHKIRASITFYTLLAYELGYKNIVLCGVDLNNTKYFYESNKYSEIFVNTPPTGQSGKIHKTNNPEYGEITVIKAINEINKTILEPNGVNLYVESNKSELTNILPIYWDECERLRGNSLEK